VIESLLNTWQYVRSPIKAWLVNNELERLCEETLVAQCKALPWRLPGGAERSHENPVTTAGLGAKIWIWNLPNTSHKRYQLDRGVPFLCGIIELDHRFIKEYEGQSVNISQMDIKRKTCDIRTWKKMNFSTYPPSTLIDTPVPSLYQCAETRSTQVFWLLSQPLPHLRFNLFVISETFATKVAFSRPSCEPLYETNTSHRK
jgi:hypothetical protein